MTPDWCWLLLLLIVCLLALTRIWQRCHHSPVRELAVTATVQRLLKPRPPDDCPACHQATAPTPETGMRLPVQPWREIKSRRGAPKRINTQGFACPNRRCHYYHITDAEVHAVVGDGPHGRHERIQTFTQGVPGQACNTTFSARRNTPLYRLKTRSQRVGEVLTALAEGLDISAAARVFGHRHATITTWLARAGDHGARLHDHWFRRLHLPHVQLDELRTRLRRRAHTLWLWVTIDPLTKLIPVVHLGPRTQASAHQVVHELRQRLTPDCLPVFTSDGLNLYFYALPAHFGQWVPATGRRTRHWQVAAGLLYGQVKTCYRRRRLVGVTYQMRCGTSAALGATLLQLGLSGKLNTAFVERVNLTIRQSIAALVRRTWATMHETPHVLAHLEWWRAYYHFARPHASLRVALAQPRERGGRRVPQRYRQRTPAMAAGLTRHRWSVTELLAFPVVTASISTA